MAPDYALRYPIVILVIHPATFKVVVGLVLDMGTHRKVTVFMLIFLEGQKGGGGGQEGSPAGQADCP